MAEAYISNFELVVLSGEMLHHIVPRRKFRLCEWDRERNKIKLFFVGRLIFLLTKHSQCTFSSFSGRNNLSRFQLIVSVSKKSSEIGKNYWRYPSIGGKEGYGSPGWARRHKLEWTKQWWSQPCCLIPLQEAIPGQKQNHGDSSTLLTEDVTPLNLELYQK